MKSMYDQLRILFEEYRLDNLMPREKFENLINETEEVLISEVEEAEERAYCEAIEDQEQEYAYKMSSVKIDEQRIKRELMEIADNI